MQSSRSSTRRDPRYDIPPGRGTVEFPDPHEPARRLTAELTKISVCGVNFEMEGRSAEFPAGTVLASEFAVGACRLAGRIVVKVVGEAGDRVQVGGLFQPTSGEDELLWVGLLAGIEATRPEDSIAR